MIYFLVVQIIIYPRYRIQAHSNDAFLLCPTSGYCMYVLTNFPCKFELDMSKVEKHVCYNRVVDRHCC